MTNWMVIKWQTSDDYYRNSVKNNGQFFDKQMILSLKVSMERTKN